ncbi:unnamed protein product, partial [Ectocarpus sp. 12 AP-2014]
GTVLDRETAGILKETEDSPLWSVTHQEDTVWRDRRLRRTGVSDDAAPISRRQLQPTSADTPCADGHVNTCSHYGVANARAYDGPYAFADDGLAYNRAYDGPNAFVDDSLAHTR